MASHACNGQSLNQSDGVANATRYMTTPFSVQTNPSCRVPDATPGDGPQ